MIGGNNSPPKQLSKVSPMVAGHAISRPRIQLARMDLSSITVQDPVAQDEEQADQVQENVEEPLQDVDQPEEPVVHEEELAATPPIEVPTRNVFDLTNIREESTLMEDSVMDMEETIISPSQMEAVQEEQEDVATREMEEPVTSTRRVSVPNNRHSIRQSLQPPARIIDETTHSPSPSNPPPDTSPYVLDAETTPVGVTRDPVPGPSVVRSVSPNLSTSLTESFFERLGDDNALEGPSWLFASVQKKKRRSGAVRKLSCIMSDLDTSSASVLDTSDIPTSRNPSSKFQL